MLNYRRGMGILRQVIMKESNPLDRAMTLRALTSWMASARKDCFDVPPPREPFHRGEVVAHVFLSVPTCKVVGHRQAVRVRQIVGGERCISSYQCASLTK